MGSRRADRTGLPRLRRVLVPVVSLLDRSASASRDRPDPGEETTRFPTFPWDLRTVILVFPPGAPFRFLNLNVTLGLTGVPFDRPALWAGSDPRDAFDLQFCLEGKDRWAAYKRYYSVEGEVRYRSGEVDLEVGERLRFGGTWPDYRIRYRQPDIDLDLSLELNSRPGLHWWIRVPRLYSHYTSFCHCRLTWRWKGETGTAELPGLHDHGWGRTLLPLRAPLRLFRYEVLRLPEDAFAIALRTEGPAGLELRNVGLVRGDDGPIRPVSRTTCRVLEWETFPNYEGRPCRVPRRWVGAMEGERGTFRYEAARATEPRAVLGEGFLHGFDYQGGWTDRAGEVIEGRGYVEQFGRVTP